MNLNEKVLFIVNLLIEPKSVLTVKQLSNYSSISEQEAIDFIDEYHNILEYENRFGKYGMDDDLINKNKLQIINSLLPSDVKGKEYIFTI